MTNDGAQGAAGAAPPQKGFWGQRPHKKGCGRIPRKKRFRGNASQKGVWGQPSQKEVSGTAFPIKGGNGGCAPIKQKCIKAFYTTNNT